MWSLKAIAYIPFELLFIKMFYQKFDANADERAAKIALTVVELKAINKYYKIKTKLNINVPVFAVLEYCFVENVPSHCKTCYKLCLLRQAYQFDHFQLFIWTIQTNCPSIFSKKTTLIYSCHYFDEGNIVILICEHKPHFFSKRVDEDLLVGKSLFQIH